MKNSPASGRVSVLVKWTGFKFANRPTYYGFLSLLRQMTREMAEDLIYDYSCVDLMADFQDKVSTIWVLIRVFLLFRWKNTNLWKNYDKCNL
jgi:hypothetical protein